MFFKNGFKKMLIGVVAATIMFGGAAHTAFATSGFINASRVNFRAEASINSSIKGVLGVNSAVEVLEGKDGWFNVRRDGVEGWVYGNYVSIGARGIGTVQANAYSINVRSGTSTAHKVIGKLDKGDTLTLLEINGNWYKVASPDGTVGWVWSKLLKVIDISTSRSGNMHHSPTVQTSQVTSKAQKIVNYAKSFLGTKYVYGGMSATQMDCSGFVKYVLREYGITVNRVAADQAKNGSWVSRSQLKPGDLVFFDTDGGMNYICHVGFYIGNNQFIHASSGKGRVTISEFNSFYNGCYMTGRRVIN